MADRVRKVSYCYPVVPHRAGQGARVLAALKAGGVDLLVFHGFPARSGKAQLDLFTEDMPTLRRVAAKNGWRLSPVKRSIPDSRAPTSRAPVHRHLTKLADAGIRVTPRRAWPRVRDATA